MRGLGVPTGRSSRGDQLVQVKLVVPKKQSGAHEDLLKKLHEIEEKDMAKQNQSFFDRLKKLFDK